MSVPLTEMFTATQSLTVASPLDLVGGTNSTVGGLPAGTVEVVVEAVDVVVWEDVVVVVLVVEVEVVLEVEVVVVVVVVVVVACVVLLEEVVDVVDDVLVVVVVVHAGHAFMHCIALFTSQ